MVHNLRVEYVIAGKVWWLVAVHITYANRTEKEKMPVLPFIPSGTLGQVVVVPAFRVACSYIETVSRVGPELCLLDVFIFYQVENQY